MSDLSTFPCLAREPKPIHHADLTTYLYLEVPRQRDGAPAAPLVKHPNDAKGLETLQGSRDIALLTTHSQGQFRHRPG